MIVENKRYEINDVFNLLGEEHLLGDSDGNKNRGNIIVDGFNVRPISLRYKTFYQKGTKCVCCGKEGTHFKLCGDETTNRRHFNLYADDGTLMTKDHIIPASKGGLDKVFNMQTMCTDCNKAKGNHYPGLEKEYIVGRTEEGHEVIFSTIEKAVMHIVLGKMNKGQPKEQWARNAVKTTMKLLSVLDTGNAYCRFVWTREMR